MKKILIIEDEQILSEMYQDTFAQAGFEVSLAFTCEEGLEIAKKEKHDLILLDILLPRESGIVFLWRFKEDSKIAEIPVIAFSNYDDPKTKQQAISLGIKAYLLKANFTPKELLEKVKEYL